MTRSVNVFKWWRPEGTALKFVKRMIAKGQFHQFGCDMEEMETNAGNYSTAIVELPDGTVITPPADMIQFTEETQAEQARTYPVPEGAQRLEADGAHV